MFSILHLQSAVRYPPALSRALSAVLVPGRRGGHQPAPSAPGAGAVRLSATGVPGHPRAGECGQAAHLRAPRASDPRILS